MQRGPACPFNVRTTTAADFCLNWVPPTIEELLRALPQYDIVEVLGCGGLGAAIEDRYQREPFSAGDTPDRVFERQWALELLRQAIEQIGADYERGYARARFG